jgi:hypothetical protein
MKTRSKSAVTGWGREGVNPQACLKRVHIVAKSDNNIVPEKQTNKGKYRPGGVCGDIGEGR